MATLRQQYRAEYGSWIKMRRRCRDPKDPAWHHYGGRGIRVCPQWQSSFEHFLDDVGPKPGPEYTIDRIDVDAHYTPDNVRWATRQQQSANRRYCHRLEVEGETLTIQEAARKLGLPPTTLRARLLRLGHSPARALTRGRLPRHAQAVEHDGRTLTVPQWASALGIRVRTLRKRLRSGIDPARALVPGALRRRAAADC